MLKKYELNNTKFTCPGFFNKLVKEKKSKEVQDKSINFNIYYIKKELSIQVVILTKNIKIQLPFMLDIIIVKWYHTTQIRNKSRN